MCLVFSGSVFAAADDAATIDMSNKIVGRWRMGVARIT
ncbi:hypothetical protein R2A130_3452 [Ahrensia sp. R2A130]|nr:hypothetical protein R2A130_3452 [Ahrensia sp. R2A130]